MSVTIVLIPVGDDPELLEWLDGFGLRPRDRALRYPTLGELRAAARSSNPAELDELFSDGMSYAFISYGPVSGGPGGQPHYEGGEFELHAATDRLDDQVILDRSMIRAGVPTCRAR